MKKVLLTFVLTVVCAALAGVTFLVVAGPSDLLRDQLVQTVKEQTGRDLAINGGTSFTVFPRLGVALRDTTISDPPEMGDAPFVRIASLELAMPLGALLRRELAIDHLVLKGAIFDLREDTRGHRNWEIGLPVALPLKAKRAHLRTPVRMASADGTLPLVLAAADPTEAAAADKTTGTALAFASLVIADGTVRYLSERTGARQEVTGLNAKARLAQASGEFSVDGGGVWRREPVQMQGSVQSIKALIDGTSPVAGKVSAAAGEAMFEGPLATAPVPQLNGRLKASTPSARALAAWLGAPLPAGPGLGPLTLAGVLGAKADLAGIKDLVATLDGETLRGDLSIVTDGQRPFASGNLSLDRLDLDTVLGANRGAAAAPSPGAKTGGKGGIGDVIEATGRQPAPAESVPTPQAVPQASPQVRGWSSVPVDLAALRAVDADLKLEIGQILYKDAVLDRARVAATLRSGVLKTVLQETGAFKGRASGTIELDTAKEPPALAVQATLEGVDAFPLLKAVAGIGRLTGRGTVVLKVAGQGATQQQIAASLTGTAAVTVADGAMIGFNLPALIRTVQKGQMPNLQASPSEKTDFKELSGSFAIANGVATTQDMKLLSPAVRVSGTGTIDLGRQLLDLVVRPKLTAGAPAPGAGQPAGVEQVIAGLDIPVLIRGPWDAPKATVDLNNVLKDPQVKKGVEQIGELLKSKEGKAAAKEIGNAVRNLLGR